MRIRGHEKLNDDDGRVAQDAARQASKALQSEHAACDPLEKLLVPWRNQRGTRAIGTRPLLGS